METINNILCAIENNKNALISIKEEANKISSDYMELFNRLHEGSRFAPLSNEIKDARAKKDAELKEAAKKEDYLMLEKSILENNLLFAYFEFIAPVLIDAWNKYSEKSAGPKTRKKIFQEIKNKTGLQGYISTYPAERGGAIVFIVDALPGRNNLEINIKDETGKYGGYFLTSENKFRKISASDLWIVPQKYIENIPEYIGKIQEARAEAATLEKSANEAAEKYNSLIVSGMKHYSDIWNRALYIQEV